MDDRRLNRRQLLTHAGNGFGLLALADLLRTSSSHAASASVGNPLAARTLHFAPRARSCIFLFMPGGPSQIDLFDRVENLPVREFEIGDRIVIGDKYWNRWFYGKEATITGYTDDGSIYVVLDDGLKWFFLPQYIQKVREQLSGPMPKIREKNKKLPSNFYIEIKRIKGNNYKYARWRENGILRSKYLGKCPLTQNSIHGTMQLLLTYP